MHYLKIESPVFTGKKQIDWKAVECYVKRYSGNDYTVTAYGDVIHINALSADEFANSQYTGRLKGAFAKVKANMATIIPEMIKQRL